MPWAVQTLVRRSTSTSAGVQVPPFDAAHMASFCELREEGDGVLGSFDGVGGHGGRGRVSPHGVDRART